MANRAEMCRQRAEECERAAARVADPQVQACYRKMSRQWHEMAERQQTIDEALAKRRKPSSPQRDDLWQVAPTSSGLKHWCRSVPGSNK